MNIYEYDNDLSIRNAIMVILNDKKLKSLPDFESFKVAVDELDKRFQALISSSKFREYGSNYWWQKGVLLRAGKEYVNDIKELYDLEVELS